MHLFFNAPAEERESERAPFSLWSPRIRSDFTANSGNLFTSYIHRGLDTVVKDVHQSVEYNIARQRQQGESETSQAIGGDGAGGDGERRPSRRPQEVGAWGEGERKAVKSCHARLRERFETCRCAESAQPSGLARLMACKDEWSAELGRAR